jgi:hypothetical protein
MRKILTTAILCAGMVGFTACDSFLEEEPKSSLTSVAYNQTEDQIIEQVNYLYRNGVPNKLADMSGAYRGSNASVQCMVTGYFTNNFEGQEVDCMYARQLTRQDWTASCCNYLSNSAWTDCYKVINIANNVIKYVDDISMSDPTKYKGEARFFRGWNYFFLVKMFGDVPMVTEPTEGNVDYPFRTTQSEVYTNVIIPDLKFAVENLPDATFAGNGHRVTKHAAAMVLADVYMRLGQYSDAVPVLQNIINSGRFSLTANVDLSLGSAFNQLRENDDLNEVIYAYERDASISNSGNFPTKAFNSSAESFFQASSTGSKYSLWVNNYAIDARYLNVYESSDLRVQPNQFFHWSYTHPIDGTVLDFDSPQNWYYYDEEAIIDTGIGTKDWNFYRYAETLLSAAECIAQAIGVTSDAASYLAQVKARANMEGKTASVIATELQSLGKQAFIEECWKERLRKFPLEMKIWDDCVRTMKFPSISSTTAGSVQFIELIGATNGSGATFKNTDLYWPIPINEIQRNPNLEQNEGYSRQ